MSAKTGKNLVRLAPFFVEHFISNWPARERIVAVSIMAVVVVISLVVRSTP